MADNTEISDMDNFNAMTMNAIAEKNRNRCIPSALLTQVKEAAEMGQTSILYEGDLSGQAVERLRELKFYVEALVRRYYPDEFNNYAVYSYKINWDFNHPSFV